jgi:hypothetical protein
MSRLDRGVMCILSQAHSVAMVAIAGENPGRAADALAEMARGLTAEHGLGQAVTAFRAVQHGRRPSAAELIEAGRALRQAVSLHLMPVPPGQGRADIHG